MTNFEDIIEYVRKQFSINVECEKTSNVLFIKVKGLDNYSLARYIFEKFHDIEVTVQEHEGYKFSDLGWIKIEKRFGKSMRLTR